jgi:hypothetical protein
MLIVAAGVLANAESNSSDRARLVLIIIGVLVALVVAFFAFSLAGQGVGALSEKLGRVMFPPRPDKIIESLPGPIGALVLAACLLSVIFAFVLDIGWLWIVAVVAGIVYGLAYLGRDAS